MLLHRRVFLLLFVAAITVVCGASTARADEPCAHANLVFYTTDTTDLAKGLGASPPACADYWISISPITAAGPDLGKPRSGPLAVIHAQGTQFHALAELRPAQWYDYAVTQGHGWYAAGELLHDSMLATGFDPTRDTWAVNEVGTPSTSSVNTDVFNGVDGARSGFRLFVQGLYDGTSGPPLPGLVFAASPPQLAPDVAGYERGLAGLYDDAAFWQDMQRYVRFWAQETYADVRAWGVPGTPLDVRTSYLDDYFSHALRLPGAARDFLDHAYVPIGNASWRQTPPDPASGPGFGSTDVPLTTMKAFVAAQTYALRRAPGAQFGFAVVPKNAGLDRAPFEAYLGGVLRGSLSDPTAACAADACTADVAGAGFTQAWLTFATPPVVEARADGPRTAAEWYTGDVTVNWDVSDPETGVASSVGCDPAVVSEDTAGTTFTCIATSTGGTTSRSVTIRRDATAPTVVCTATPSTVWPPNGKLVPVTVDVEVTDATSGPAGFALVAAPAADSGAWDVGTADVTGSVRAERSGDGGDRVYTLTYTGRDLAGNTATCDATVTVPHDRGD